ncbi:MAG: rRNA maturation RNase YbeY [Bacteroidia bacterium]|nr:rRNA maturation RNase YbeY [Bacteroidia bacterium]
MAIQFHTQHITKPKFKIGKTRTWLVNNAINEGFKIKEINYILMSDDDLLQMNIDYLQHDYYTDIITFDNTTDAEREKKQLVADIFISVDRVADNALQNNVTTNHELMRIMIHGLLHLCSYNDKTKAQQQLMRKKENEYLDVLFL